MIAWSTAIVGNEVIADAPLSASLDQQYVKPPGAMVVPYTFDGRIGQVGGESLHLVAPKKTVPISAPSFSAISMDAVLNA